MYSTAYHPQSDGQSERTNQTVEIVLRFSLATLYNAADWKRVVGPVRSAVNSSKSTSTPKSLNEIVYGFTPTQSTDLISSAAIQGQLLLPPKFIRMEIADAIAFAQMASKTCYD